MKSDFVIQIIGLIGSFLFFISFQCKSNKNFFECNLCLIYAIHFIFYYWVLLPEESAIS